MLLHQDELAIHYAKALGCSKLLASDVVDGAIGYRCSLYFADGSFAAGHKHYFRNLGIDSLENETVVGELVNHRRGIGVEVVGLNCDVGVGDMAEAAATSRSGLQRKLKKAMGITPQDLLREARIKHACRLLRETDKTVAEVSYACGFTDPKYFSRCFKQSTGMSPSEYKTAP